jgi:hypothetical protein
VGAGHIQIPAEFNRPGIVELGSQILIEERKLNLPYLVVSLYLLPKISPDPPLQQWCGNLCGSNRYVLHCYNMIPVSGGVCRIRV